MLCLIDRGDPDLRSQPHAAASIQLSWLALKVEGRIDESFNSFGSAVVICSASSTSWRSALLTSPTRAQHRGNKPVSLAGCCAAR